MILLYPRLTLTLMALALSLGMMDVQAASSKPHETNATNTSSDAKPKKRRVAKPVPAIERTASGETVADRERRLKRECKGRPNAGACLGFAN